MVHLLNQAGNSGTCFWRVLHLVYPQVTAMAIFHLLDFGSGFDAMLLAKTGKGGRAVTGGVPQRLFAGSPLGSWVASVRTLQRQR